MTQRAYRPVDTSRLKTYSIENRKHKASTSLFAKLPPAGASAAELVASLPDCLGASAFRKTANAIATAVKSDRPVVLAMGAHVIKVGCSPVIIDMIRRKLVQAISVNGAYAIHDSEIAFGGATSEEVADTIRDGTFGMVSETLDFFGHVMEVAESNNCGLGEAVGRSLIEAKASNVEMSVLAEAYKAGIPATVHVAVGTDTVHMSHKVDGRRLGEATMHDFRLICDVVSDLGANGSDGPGGVWLNIGSTVLLPEVFLKAVSVARNLGANLDAMVTANFDMLRHYRPTVNVIKRPVQPGFGHEVIGHHEILLPLLRQAIIDQLV